MVDEKQVSPVDLVNHNDLNHVIEEPAKVTSQVNRHEILKRAIKRYKNKSVAQETATPSFNKIYEFPKQQIADILRLEDNFALDKGHKKLIKKGTTRERWFAQPIGELILSDNYKRSAGEP